MIDIHTHILYNIDDGSKSIEESINILLKSYRCGYTDVVLTPHYMYGTKYNANNTIKRRLFKELKKWCDCSGLNINIYLGNEIYVSDDDVSFTRDVLTINNSRYVLIELPLNSKYTLLDEYLNKLKKKKLIPIIAHPERYTEYYKDYDFFNSLINKGCLLQGNVGSIYGVYGNRCKKMIKYMLKHNMITFLATDTHHIEDKMYNKHIEEDLYKIVKDKKVVNELLNINAYKVLNDLDL